MMISANTQATLLLIAPLITAGEEGTNELVTASDYRKLLSLLKRYDLEPEALLEGNELPAEVHALATSEKYQRLLARSFQLSQAIERWQSRGIWVVGQSDQKYPTRLLERLKEHAPPIIYGCGDPSLLEAGGLAVVGSRDVDQELVQFTQAIGQLAAEAEVAIISGGARGIDQASMQGALEAGGRVVGVLADSLERAVVRQDHQELLSHSRLTLITVFDPAAGFNVGHAMQRNKLIYALADAALVVNSDLGTGGTWAGAVEQLDRFQFVPVYVRTTGEIGAGLKALEQKGALPWPNPATREGLLGATKVQTQTEQLSFL